MKKMKKILSLILAVIMLFTVAGCKSADMPPSTEKETKETETAAQVRTESTDESAETTVETQEPMDLMQRNSVAMLNYLAMLTQEINASKNNRIYLDEVYSILVNSTNPETVDNETVQQIKSLFQTIESHMLNGLARERTQYLLEQSKAAALLGAVADSVNDSVAIGMNIRKIVKAMDNVQNMASRATSLVGGVSDYLQAAWQLEDEEIKTIFASRNAMFEYRVKIVQDYHLPAEMSLSEENVNLFVEKRQGDNVTRKIQFFESNEKVYQYFGPYWLELVECYARNENYEKCLEAFSNYNALKSTAFLKEYDYARALPHVIMAAQNVYEGDQYVAFAERILEELLENASLGDWELRYFAAQAYIDLYNQTQNPAYLQKAYTIVLNNVNNLAEQQKNQNDIYLKSVVEIPAPSAETDAEKKQRVAYNDQIKETRKTELPPVFEPLTINCDLLFALIKEPGVGEINQAKIKGILSDSDEHVFMSEYLKEKYSFDYEKGTCKAEFLEDELVIPVTFLTDNSKIRVSVTEDGTTSVYEDWKIDRVERRDASVSSFMAIFESEEISDQKWSDDSKVTVEILEEDATAPFVTMVFEVEDSTSYVLWTDYTFVQVQ